MRRRQLVIAGNFDQFNQYIKENEIDKRRATYVSSSGNMMGFRGKEIEIIYVGTYNARRDLAGIQEYVERLARDGAIIKHGVIRGEVTHAKTG